MKVLFLAESLSIRQNTGVASTMISLAQSLDRWAEVELVAPTPATELEETQRCLSGLTAHLFPQPQFLPRTVVPALGRFVTNELPRFDLVHIHGLWRYPQWVASRRAQSLKIPYILSPHGMCEPFELARKAWKKQLFFNLVEKRTFQGAAAIHAITEAERGHCTQLEADKKIEVIPHGVEIQAALPAALIDFYLPPAIAAIPPQAPVVLFMGRLHPKKGLDLLIPAFAQVLQQHPSAYLVLAGPDATGYQANLVQLAKSFQIQERILFTGMLVGQQKQAMLQRADVFTLPSYSEGFSVAILEALAAAKPVVISKYCYFDEVTSVGCGQVVDTDISQLAQALNHLLALDAPARANLGQRGQQLIEHKYTWSIAAKKMMGLYQSVLADQPKLRPYAADLGGRDESGN